MASTIFENGVAIAKMKTSEDESLAVLGRTSVSLVPVIMPYDTDLYLITV